MPELNLEPQALCALSDLADRGRAHTFELLDREEPGRPVPAFVLRQGDRLHAYLNRCAHVPAEMDWQPGQFWDHEARYIICAVHGALYEPDNGRCVSGPCPGARLQPVRVAIQGEQVYWYPDERFQPVF